MLNRLLESLSRDAAQPGASGPAARRASRLASRHALLLALSAAGAGLLAVWGLWRHSSQDDALAAVSAAMVLLLSGLLYRALRQVASSTLTLERLQSQALSLAEVLQHSPSPVVVGDAQGRLLWCNQAFEQLSGYALADLQGRRPAELLRGEHADAEAARRVDAAIARGESCQARLVNRHRSGRLYWVDVRVSPIFSRDGRTLQGFYSIEDDVTEALRLQQQLEQALAESRQLNQMLRAQREAAAREALLLDTAVNGGQMTVWRARLDTGSVRLGEECARRLGLERPRSDGYTHLTGPAIIALRHPEDTPRHRLSWQRMVTDQAEFHDGEFRYRRSSSGEWLWFHEKGRVVERDPAGRPLEASGVLMEVTDRKRAELALQKATDQLQTVSALANTGFWEVDFAQSSVELSAAGRAIVGLAPNEPAGLDTLAERFEPVDSRPRIWRAMRLARESLCDFDLQLELQLESGTRRWVRLVGFPVAEHDGRCERVFGSVQDIDRLVRAQQESLRASEAKSRFLATMSHEIRTPLTGVLGLLELLVATPMQHAQRHLLAQAQGSAQSLLGIVDNVLDYSRIESGHMELRQSVFTLQALMDGVRNVLVGNAQRPAVALEIGVDPALPTALVGDPVRLQQVLVNLGGNALKFTTQGRVSVRALALAPGPGETKGAPYCRLRLEVQDSGIGMKPEQLEHIFDDFAQADASIGHRYGGSGLGLAICARLVALMQSRIEVHSQPGRGSTFHFDLELPLAPAGAQVLPAPGPTGAALPAPATDHQPRSSGALDGVRVLLAEDNEVNQLVVSEMLQSAGAKVEAHANGWSALQALSQRPTAFDIALMDMRMPMLDGLQTTRRLRANPRLSGLPVVAMTANSSTTDRDACLAAGMDDFLGKPFSRADLIAMIERRLHLTDTPPGQGAAPLAAPEPSAPVAASPLDLPRGLQQAPVQGWAINEALERFDREPRHYVPVLDLFSQSLPAELQAAQARWQQGQWADASALLHSLKGAAALVGASGLAGRLADAQRTADQLAYERVNTGMATAMPPFPLSVEGECERLRAEVHAVGAALQARTALAT